ncbi:MAG TPA: 7-cyano-7-deazaguanine synthase QueC [Bacteroidota bacterium]|nr:7-cyano-7-deazaguanine synthase QueC [Bacteroidota bacterium]
MNAPGLAVVLVSGGMDSLVCAAIAAQTHALAFLHVNYGQRTEKKELSCFHAIADHYGVSRRLVLDAGHLAAIGGSSLTDESIEVEKADLDRKGVPSSYVPFRNANILSMAVSWAEVTGAREIFIGAVEEDSSGYPDCRREFYDAFNKVVAFGTRPGSGIEIVTPVIGMTKSEIVKTGIGLGAPFDLTWSCYQNEDRACGVCDSCALRLRGFQLAGVDDPLPYRSPPVIPSR